MPQTACPYCGANLYPHEVTNGECTSCMRRLPERFLSEADWERAPRRVPEPAGRREEPRGDFQLPLTSGYGLVRSGVNLVRWGVGLNFLMEILGGLVLFVALGAGRQGLGEAALFLPIGVGLLRLGVALILFLGVCFCCAVPRRSEGAGWGRGLIVCLMLTLVLGMAAVAVPTAASLRGGRQEELLVVFVLDLIALALAVFAGALCFFMTLRGVARDFGDLGLGGGFLAYFITSLVVSFGAFGGVFTLILAGATNVLHGPRPFRGGNGEAALVVVLVLGCVAIVVGLALVFWLLTLLTRLYNLLSRASPGRRFPDDGRWER